MKAPTAYLHALLNPRGWRGASALSTLTGILLIAAHPPLHAWPVAWVSLIPLLVLAIHSRPLAAFSWAWAAHTLFHGVSMFWLVHHPDLNLIVWVLVSVALSVFAAIPYVAASIIARRNILHAVILFPFALAGMEWARSFDQFAFPWFVLGNTQTGFPFIIQFADTIGVYGVSWWIASLNAAAVLLVWRHRTVSRWVLLTALIAVPMIYGAATYSRSYGNPDARLNVAVIQGNVSIEDKWAAGMTEWNALLYQSMSVESLAYKPDLIVWPETAVPEYVMEVQYYQLLMQSFVDTHGVPILSGIPAIDIESGNTWNAAGLFMPGESNVQRYFKTHLVPIGEAIPYDNIIPALGRLDFGQANWTEGEEYTVFKEPGLPAFNAAICFESIFTDLMRHFADCGSEMFVVITNDAWFGRSASPVQHQMISVMRAIEFRRPVVRAANTGISCFIDASGRITEETALLERAFRIETVQPSSVRTVYARFGYLFGAVAFLVSFFPAVFYLIRYTKPRTIPGS
jgi:apolipoprotein N-acyltransferase